MSADDEDPAAPPVWVLLRGLTREQRHWGTFAQALREALPHATVVTLDLPGNGELHRLPSPTRVEAMAAYCRGALRERGLAPPYRVLAMSLGAMVATAWCAQHPQDVAALVLINTSLRPFSPWYRRLRPSRYATLLRLMLARRDVLTSERAVLAMTSNARARDAGLVQRWAGYRREHPVAPANALRQLWAAARYRAPRAMPSAEVLLLASARDRLVDSRCSAALARAWGCRLAWHPWAGHDLPLDDQRWVVDQVREWMDARAP
jgi:pimeloyl-ACP methyl ester carboxylesterase